LRTALVCGAGGFIGGPLVKQLKRAGDWFRGVDIELYSERVAVSCERRYGMQVRIARFQNCYAVEGAWRGRREKAPAAM